MRSRRPYDGCGRAALAGLNTSFSQAELALPTPPYQPNWPEFFDGATFNRTAPGHLQRARECVVWGIGNETQAMGAMAARGINMMMPYSFSPFQRHGIPSTAATRAATATRSGRWCGCSR